MMALTKSISKARTLKLAGAFVVLCAAMFLVASPAWANTIVVNSTADDTDGNDGECTLREAIASANNDTASGSAAGECAAGAGSDEITFNLPDVSDEITLGGTQLRINSNLAITGPGADRLTVSGNNASRVFEVTSASTAGISGLTITGGNADTTNGGGIRSAGTLTLRKSAVSGNSAIGSGGGILNNNGTLTVTGSTVSGNSATKGGGVFSIINSNSDTTKTTITNSTISGNEASFNGGGVFNENGLTVIENSTITKNTAPEGAGSGVACFGDNITRMKVSSSIIAANTNTDVDFVVSPINSFQSNGYNLIGDGNATGNFTAANNDRIIGNESSGLEVLANNGGPTKTHALLPGSPALDRGTSAGLAPPATDQRGAPRPQEFPDIENAASGDGSDIGAYELRPAAISTDPPSLEFDDTPVDERSEVRAVKVENTGEVALEIERSEIVGPNLASFQKTGDTCSGESVAPGESCELRVRFTPADEGSASGTLRITSNALDSPARVSLSGTGIVAPAPTVASIDPDYGEQGETLPVTITGSGFSDGATAYLARDSIRLGISNVAVNDTGDGTTGSLAIPDGFPTGEYDAVVENADGKSGTLAGAFVVESVPEPPAAPAPELTSASPDNGKRGETVILQIVGANLDADTSIRLAKGRVVLWASSVAENGSGGLRAEISIPADFPIGDYDVIAENPDAKSDTLAAAFEIAAPEPAPNPLGCTVFGTPGKDRLVGTPRRDVICGFDGSDTIFGLGGNDIIYGGPGNDTVYGMVGNDILLGGAGNDRLIGGSGRDRLFGQAGNDRLNARDGVRGNDIANGGAGRDICASDPRDIRRNCP